MFKHSLLTRANISSYYIALLFSTLLWQQEWFKAFILNLRNYFLQFITIVTKGGGMSEWNGYLALVLSCAFVVILMRWIVVKPANLFLEDETARDFFESVPFFVLVFGAFLYYVNVQMGGIMPKTIPEVVRSFLGASGDITFATNLWNTGPIIMFFLVNRHRKQAASVVVPAEGCH